MENEPEPVVKEQILETINSYSRKADELVESPDA
jgi:hypothetical protein